MASLLLFSGETGHRGSRCRRSGDPLNGVETGGGGARGEHYQNINMNPHDATAKNKIVYDIPSRLSSKLEYSSKRVVHFKPAKSLRFCAGSRVFPAPLRPAESVPNSQARGMADTCIPGTLVCLNSRFQQGTVSRTGGRS